MSEPGSSPAAPITVVVVDDHAVVRSGLAALLATAADLRVVGLAADGDAAYALVAEHRPDVVLMDLSMPGSDGVVATRRVHTDFPDSHVVVLTSLGEQRWIAAALEAGAEGYLLKQSEPEVIIAGIREVVAGGAPLDPKAARVLLTSRFGDQDLVEEWPLTEREAEVLTMVTEGLPNKLIARRMGIAERTVKAHLTHVFSRLGVADRTQAALWAQRHRQPPDRGERR